MDEKQLEDLLYKYKKGQCTPEELDILSTLSSHDITEGEPKKDHPQKEEVWRRINRHQRLVFIARYSAAAAVLLFLSFGLYLFFQNQENGRTRPLYTNISSKRGVLKKLELPDGTRVWLNSGSRLRYPRDYNVRKREVYLDEGEAFFEVSPDAEKPFAVHSKHLRTLVLGTSFNVKAYSTLKTEVISVRTGRVGVSDAGKQLAPPLSPGQQLMYNKTGKNAVVISAEDSGAFGWTNHETVLKDASFNELVLALENRFDVEFTLPKRDVSVFRYNIHLKKDITLASAINILKSIDGLTYSLKGDTVWVR